MKKKHNFSRPSSCNNSADHVFAQTEVPVETRMTQEHLQLIEKLQTRVNQLELENTRLKKMVGLPDHGDILEFSPQDVSFSAHHNQSNTNHNNSDHQHNPALKNLLASFKAIFNNSTLGAAICDLDGHMILFNSRLHNMLGYSENDLIDKTLWQITHPDDITLSQDKMNDLLRGRTAFYRIEKRYFKKTGDIFWAEAVVEPIRNERGDIENIAVIVVDINARKKMEHDLKENEDILSQSLDIARAGIWTWHIPSDELKLCHRLLKMLGYKNHQLPTTMQGIRDLCHPDEQHIGDEMIEMLRQGKLPAGGWEFRFRREDGSWLWAGLRAKIAQSNPDGKPVRIIGTAIDITENKMAMTQIQQSEKLLRQVIDTCPVCIYIKNNRGQYILANAKLAQIFDLPFKKIIGQTDSDFANDNFITRQEADRFMSSDQQAIITKQPVFIEQEGFPMPDGRMRHFQTNKIPVFLQREGHCVLGITADITEQFQAQQDLVKSRQELRDLTRHLYKIKEENRIAIGRELHDSLGQYLAALRMDIGRMIKKSGHPPHVAQLVDPLLTTIDNCIDIVHRVCADLRPGLLDDFGLKAALEQLLDDFSKRTGIDVVFECNLDPLNWNKELATHLYRIVQEAITNTARHANAKNIYVKLYQTCSDYVLLIKDNGIGVRPDQIARPDSFGLIGMRERAYLLDGRFHIEGTQNNGTKITIHIPFHTGRPEYEKTNSHR